MEVHRDESWCPILKLRRALRESGIDAHAREDGVFIPMTSSMFAKSIGDMRQSGLCVEWTDGGALVKDRDAMLESVFKEGFAKGVVDADGVVDASDYLFFAKACDMGLVERRNGRYVLSDPMETVAKALKYRPDIKDPRRLPQDAYKEGNKTLDNYGKEWDPIADLTPEQDKELTERIREDAHEKRLKRYKESKNQD